MNEKIKLSRIKDKRQIHSTNMPINLFKFAETFVQNTR